MNATRLSLCPDPPTGFAYRAVLTRRDVRRGAFALFVDTPEQAAAALQGLGTRLTGIVITCAQTWSGSLTNDGRLIWLTLPAAWREHAAELTNPWLALLDAYNRTDDAAEGLRLRLERAAKDRQRLAGEFGSLRGTLVNEIVERRRIETALRHSETRYRTIIDSVNEAIFIHEPDTGVILDINQRATELFGYTRESLLNQDIGTLSANTPPYTAADGIHWIRRAMTGTPQAFEWHSRARDGRLFWTDVNIRHMLLDGQMRILVTIRDSSARKQAEALHHESEARLLHAQKLESLGVLAGGIAHDFNNLLMAILGNADMALAELPHGVPARQYLAEIGGAVQRATDLCRQLLACSGKGHFNGQPIHIGSLIAELLERPTVLIPKQAVIRYNLSDSLPTVYADTAQLRQIVMNLVVNAAESLGDKQGSITVTTGLLQCDRDYLTGTLLGDGLSEGRYVYIDISDTGCGMDPDTVERIFDPFFTTKFTGRGLGLAAVLGLVRAHHGGLRVTSEAGKGTTFRVLLAVAEAVPAGADGPAPVRDPDACEAGAILVVDDEDAIRTLTCRMVERLGYRPLSAATGEEALRRFTDATDAGRQPAAVMGVLMDLAMPNMDGIATSCALRNVVPDVRVILSSGHDVQDISRRYAHERFTGFVQKPYTLSELRQKLTVCLEAPQTGSGNGNGVPAGTPFHADI